LSHPADWESRLFGGRGSKAFCPRTPIRPVRGELHDDLCAISNVGCVAKTHLLIRFLERFAGGLRTGEACRYFDPPSL
jgi:hypothetical protein